MSSGLLLLAKAEWLTNHQIGTGKPRQATNPGTFLAFAFEAFSGLPELKDVFAASRKLSALYLLYFRIKNTCPL